MFFKCFDWLNYCNQATGTQFPTGRPFLEVVCLFVICIDSCLSQTGVVEGLSVGSL